MPTEEQYRDYRTYEKALDPTIACEIQRLFPSFPRKTALKFTKSPTRSGRRRTCNADHVRCFQSRLRSPMPMLGQSSTQVRHLDYISQFTSDIRHVKGEDNTAADALSRLSAIKVDSSVTVDFEAIAQAQQDDKELRELHASLVLHSYLQCHHSM